MSESVSLPALGESVTEGTVTRWLKQVGDRVEVDEPLLEVSTDKVDTEIPSPVAGVIEAILVAEDETVEVGTVLVTIGTGSDAPAEATPAEAPAAVAPAAVAPVAAAPVAAVPAAAAPAAAAPAAAAPAAEAPVAVAPVASTEPSVPEAAHTAEVPVTPTEVAAAPADSAPAAEVPSTDAPAPAEVEAAVAAAAAAAAAEPKAAAAPDFAPAPEAVTSGQAAPAAPTEAVPAPSTVPDAHAGYVTPLVRKLANEHGVSLDGLVGTGVGGRIRKQDVLEASKAADAAASLAAASEAAASETTAATIVAAAAQAVSPLRGTTVPMSRLRKVIAERAVISMQSSAQLTSVVEVDVTLVANLRNRVKADFQAKTGQKLSFLPFFALAAVEALTTNPIINATIDGDTIVYPPQENMAIAVDTERGLLTPVIRDAASLDLAGFAAQIADLAARTRENKLKPDELAGGTFTLTNTGSRGALFDTPIVFLPQSAILGTGIVVKKPVVVSDAAGDAIAIRSMVFLALSYDHRIVDGADAARFLVTIKDRLEAGNFEGNLGI